MQRVRGNYNDIQPSEGITPGHAVAFGLFGTTAIIYLMLSQSERTQTQSVNILVQPGQLQHSAKQTDTIEPAVEQKELSVTSTTVDKKVEIGDEKATSFHPALATATSTVDTKLVEVMEVDNDSSASVIDVRCNRSDSAMNGWRSPSIAKVLDHMPTLFDGRSTDEITMAYSDKDLICDERSWFKPNKTCTDSCCVSTCILPWDKSERAVIKSIWYELGDIRQDVKLYGPGHKGRMPPVFHPWMLPCLRAGTIITVGSGKHVVKWLKENHPRIHVPYVMTMGDSDWEVPRELNKALEEEHLLSHVFALNANPDIIKSSKFTPLPLGLSRWHPQALYIDSILKEKSYINPFERKDQRACWKSFVQSRGHRKGKLFMSYMTTKGRGELAEAQRAHARKAACNNNKDGLTDCPGKISIPDMYRRIDDLNFGISPEGHGHDCYRTWEYLYLGMIPIVEKANWTGNLYDDLPVLELKSFNITHEELKDEMDRFTSSQKFQTSTFSGWEKLFLAYWRREALRAAGRFEDPIVDPTTKTQYFEIFKYSKTQ